MVALATSTLVIAGALKLMPKISGKEIGGLVVMGVFMAALGVVAADILRTISDIQPVSMETVMGFSLLMTTLVITTIPLIIAAAVIGSMQSAADKALIGMGIMGLLMLAMGGLAAYIGSLINTNVPNPAAVTGNLMATIGLALTLMVFPAGLLSDRVGRRGLNLLAGALAAVGIFLLIFARDVASLYAFGGIIGMATGIFVSVNWALATDLIPQEEAGKYLGLSNLATAGSGAASRLAGPLIDGLNALRPGAHLGYPALFLLASASTLLGTLLMLRVRKR